MQACRAENHHEQGSGKPTPQRAGGRFVSASDSDRDPRRAYWVAIPLACGPGGGLYGSVCRIRTAEPDCAFELHPVVNNRASERRRPC
jgi:hypothetical protein